MNKPDGMFDNECAFNTLQPEERKSKPSNISKEQSCMTATRGRIREDQVGKKNEVTIESGP